MKVKKSVLLLSGLSLLLISSAIYAGSSSDVVSFTGVDSSTVEELHLAQKMKSLAIGILTYVVSPTVGFFTCFKGWKMIGDAQRDSKGPGVIVLICGIGCFALPTIITQVIAALNSSATP